MAFALRGRRVMGTSGGSSSALSDMYIPSIRICWSCRRRALNREMRRRKREKFVSKARVEAFSLSFFQHAIPPFWENHIALSMHRHSELANTDVGLQLLSRRDY